MTDLRQAAQQALEALENIDRAMPFPVGKQASTALREALAQPEQEPTCPTCKAAGLYECVACSNNNYPPRPEQEPTPWRDMVVVTLVREGIDKHRARELADHFAAKRPWRGLTDEEVQFYIKKHSKLFNAGYDKVTDTNLVAKTFDSTGFYKEVSTVLKERNTCLG
jgi:hypothetical protein